MKRSSNLCGVCGVVCGGVVLCCVVLWCGVVVWCCGVVLRDVSVVGLMCVCGVEWCCVYGVEWCCGVVMCGGVYYVIWCVWCVCSFKGDVVWCCAAWCDVVLYFPVYNVV